MNWKIGRVLALAAAMGCGLMHAAPVGVLGLHNTGTDSNNDVLVVTPDLYPTQSLVTDLNYGVSGFGAVVPKTLHGSPSYASEAGLNARWITGTDAAGSVETSTGVYSYTYTVDLTLWDPSTVSITGQFAADNCGEVWVNGGATGFSTGSPADVTCDSQHSNFNSLHNFSLNAGSGGGFHSGLNTIEFRVYNSGGPSGLLVNFTEGFAESAVPEPGTYGMMGMALVALGYLRRRQ